LAALLNKEHLADYARSGLEGAHSAAVHVHQLGPCAVAGAGDEMLVAPPAVDDALEDEATRGALLVDHTITVVINPIAGFLGPRTHLRRVVVAVFIPGGAVEVGVYHAAAVATVAIVALFSLVAAGGQHQYREAQAQSKVG
jgi:hypothetical protein